MTDMTVANTIRAQLGGNRFAAMTGAKLFIGGADYLTFKLPANFARNGINCVRIRLTAADLYDVEFMKVRGVNLKTIADHSGIYADQLRELFTRETGLHTSL